MFVADEKNGGVEFEVIAKPKASRNGIMGEHDGALKVGVTVSPEKGRANTAILKLLAKSLGIPVSSVSILKGEKSRRKRIRVEEMRLKWFREHVDKLLREAGE